MTGAAIHLGTAARIGEKEREGEEDYRDYIFVGFW